MTKDTITVWVTSNDDENTPYVVNTEQDMRTNYDDLIDSINEPVMIKTGSSPINYDPSRVFRMTDPDTYEVEFRNYCDTWDVEIEMPLDVYLADDDADQRWLATQPDVTGERN